MRQRWASADKLTRMLAESRIEVDLDGPVGFLALHGGIESGTASLALRAASRVGGSALIVRQQSNDTRLHVSSNEFAPELFPQLRLILDHCPVIVSLHGHNRRAFAHHVMVGGQNRVLAGEMASCLRRHTERLAVIDDLAVIPPEINGTKPANPVNIAAAGTQLEIPHLPDVTRPWSLHMDPRVEDELLAGLCEFADLVHRHN
ncbi:poly-gamma-glutamate hydrolase family protein [Nocardia beijingensis]